MNSKMWSDRRLHGGENVGETKGDVIMHYGEKRKFKSFATVQPKDMQKKSVM